MKEIDIVVSAKAGHGKTTTAHVISTMLRALGCRVQLNDQDDFHHQQIEALRGVKVTISTQQQNRKATVSQ